jgi:peptidyl-prolyl cis-trans isomerase SurA
MMKRVNVILALIFSVFFMQLAIASQPLNSVVAVVNSEVITQSDLNHGMAMAQKQLAASNANISQTKLRHMVLQQLIDEKLILQIAKQTHITVSDAQVTQAIQHIAAANHATVAQLQSAIQQQGMNFNAYRKMIHKQILIHQVQVNAVGPHVKITAQDKQKALQAYQSATQPQQQFHVIDILASTQTDAQKIMAQLKKGANVNTVAPKNTTDLGWQTVNTLPNIFVQRLSTMKTGDVAGPIQAPNGFHVIQLAGVRGQATSTPNKAQIQNMAYQLALQRAVKKWMVQLRKTAYIQMSGK